MHWLFTKIKKCSGTSFLYTLSAYFFHKNVPYLIFHHEAKFQHHSGCPSQDIKQNVLVNFCLTNW